MSIMGHFDRSSRSDRVSFGRFGQERDLDGLLLLLVSDAGRYMTGTTIVADGGQLVALKV